MTNLTIILALSCVTFSSLHVHYDLAAVFAHLNTNSQEIDIRMIVILLLLLILIGVAVYYARQWLDDRNIEPGRIFV